MASDGTFKQIQDRVFAALVATTRTVGQISNEDLVFQRTLNPSVAHLLDKQNSRLLQSVQKLIRGAAAGTEVPAPRLQNADEIEDNWESFVDVVDSLLEKTDACLDEYTGVIKKLDHPHQDQPGSAGSSLRKQRPTKTFRTQDIPKPQLLFNKVISNNETTAFKPLLRSKPNAIVPLQESLGSIFNEDAIEQYKHPYETEILQSKYPPSTYTKSDPIFYLPFETTSATFVDTPEAVTSMLEELKEAKEIAIDLEHHDERSYIGLVSLMQISTREKDWVVDTLKPWREDLQVLNEVFTDPSIVKVFHGSSMDMIWLQRDLGLYVVGLFDTYHASHSLKYQGHGLASLLSKFTNYKAEKQYQMADWRIRPLPAQMFNYARSDTHFLLYIYDRMRNELIEKSESTEPRENLVDVVLARSKEEALRRYERPFHDSERGSGPLGWYHMICRTPMLFSREQFAVFKAVHQWRDNVARQEDESLHLVMPKYVMLNIAREMPIDMASLLRCSHPISAPTRNRISDLLRIITTAKAAGATGPELKEVSRSWEVAYSSQQVGQGATGSLDPAPKHSVNDESGPPKVQPKNPCIKLERSRFWGDIFGGSAWEVQETRNTLQPESLRLALPLPQLTAEIFEDLKAEAGQHNQSPPSEHQFVKHRAEKEDDVFIIKQVGGSRKRKIADVQEASTQLSENIEKEDEMKISHNDVDEDAAQEKAERKAERKARRKLEAEMRKFEELQEMRKLEELQDTNDGGDGGDQGDFDYANAPSVLHAKRDGNDRAGPAKSFDPYSKSLDAPKGMRKSKKEIAGKSFTFKG